MFHLAEEVAGMYADLHGRFPYIEYPNVAAWTATAYYPVLRGLSTVRIREGGTIRLEETGELFPELPEGEDIGGTHALPGLFGR